MMARATEMGAGEAADRARRRGINAITAALMLAGGLVGAIVLISGQGNGDLLHVRMPAGWAIAAAVILVASIAIGSLVFLARVDEVELRDNAFASMVALYAYMTGYAGWFLLWRGQVVPEPSHQWLFAATFAVNILAYLWKKLRP